MGVAKLQVTETKHLTEAQVKTAQISLNIQENVRSKRFSATYIKSADLIQTLLII